MAKRKKVNQAHRREAERAREESRPVNRVRRHPRALVVVSVCLIALVALAFIAQNLDLTNYDRCFGANDGPTLQSYKIAVFIQIGDATGLATHSIRVSNSTGALTGDIQCKYPVHVLPGDPNTRGPFYTPLAVESPYGGHQYTLGDFFSVWGYWLHMTNRDLPDEPLSFSPTKVSYYTSPSIEVRVVANVNINTFYPWNDAYTSSAAFQNTPLQPGNGYYIIIHDPWTDTGTAY